VAAPALVMDRSVPLHVWIGYQVAAVAVVLDQATKRVAEVVLDRGVEVPFLSDAVGWQLVYNPGGAYGIDMPSWFFLVVTVVVTAIVVRNLPEAPSLRAATAYGLLLAGALGNAVDRVFRAGDPGDPAFFHGHVIDFVAWGSFPRFNVADIAITIGFGLLVLDLWRGQDDEEATPVPADEDVSEPEQP
jgi:signal peptidase II